MFCEIAMDVRDRSPFSYTKYFGLHERLGRISPTAKGFEERGYEPRTSSFTPQVEADVGQTFIDFIEGFRR